MIQRVVSSNLDVFNRWLHWPLL